jgi:hypothetical protein
MRGSTQVKVQIRKWAEESGLWKQFVDVRERLKKDGMPPADAWLEAARELDSEMWGQVGGQASPALDLPHGRSAPLRVERVEPDQDQEGVQGESEPVVSKPAQAGEAATKAVFAGKKVATVKVVEWVASNMQVADVIPSDAPSSEAWGMLVWARRSPVNESQFWGSIYAKLLPSRSAIESEQRYSDDGIRMEETATRLLKMRDDTESQREAL